jgi:hypothetical protein
MTTLIEDLKALIAPLAAGGAWYAVNSQQPPTYPYIVFQRIVSTPNVSLSGPSSMQNTRFQIDIYSLSIAEAVGIEDSLEAAMTAWAVQNVPLSSQDFFEDAVRAFRVSKDYSVWATN